MMNLRETAAGYLDVVAVMDGVDGRKQVVHDDEAEVRRAEGALVAIHAQKMREQCLVVRDDVVVVPA
jgi:hypothetical protein